MKSPFNEWLKEHAWVIAIALAGFISSWSVNSYRLDQQDQRIATNTNAIIQLNATNVQIQISLARIETDLAYIKNAIAK